MLWLSGCCFGSSVGGPPPALLRRIFYCVGGVIFGINMELSYVRQRETRPKGLLIDSIGTPRPNTGTEVL